VLFNIVLHEPQIPPNTGNIIRLCANTGCALHLIEPLGFALEQPQLRRAGLDYADLSAVTVHTNFDTFLEAENPERLFTFSTQHHQAPGECRFRNRDALVFGSETRGLPASIRQLAPENHRVVIPMRPGSRSLNLSNAVAVAVYEGWRQLGYSGAHRIS
jgi:tRNA (cytidine/uridine-2'-O-)-methyltransferase|tara:strand:+ start:180 stop:656 length:477 start_codon:yes stop_codon:yes gene_type:complete